MQELVFPFTIWFQDIKQLLRLGDKYVYLLSQLASSEMRAKSCFFLFLSFFFNIGLVFLGHILVL